MTRQLTVSISVHLDLEFLNFLNLFLRALFRLRDHSLAFPSLLLQHLEMLFENRDHFLRLFGAALETVAAEEGLQFCAFELFGTDSRARIGAP